MKGLTQKQAELREFVRSYIDKNKFSPNYTEIADALGLASKSGVVRLVDGLVARGVLTKGTGGRSLELVGHSAETHLRGLLMAVRSKDQDAIKHFANLADAFLEGRAA